MASIIEHKLKNGKSYTIQVKVDGKFKTTTIKAPENMKQNEINRYINKIANEFEEKVRTRAKDIKQDMTFSECAERWLEVGKCSKSQSYLLSCESIICDLNRFIGNKPLKALTRADCEQIFIYLNNKIVKTSRAKLKKPIEEMLKNHKIKSISEQCGFNRITLQSIKNGKYVQIETANTLAKVLGFKINDYFEITTETRPYSKESKLMYRRTLNAILNYAVENDFVDRNVANSKALKNMIGGQLKEKDILSLNETMQLIDAIKREDNIKVKTAVALLFYTGMRKSELCGLEWKDLNLLDHKLSINRNSIFISKIGLITKEPKTEKSKRTIKICSYLNDILIEYKNYYMNEKARLGDYFHDNDRLMVLDNGNPINPETINHWLTNLLIKNGLRKVTPHSLRHTHITLQLRDGISVKVIARNVGHCDASMILKVYSHYLVEDEDTTANLFDNKYC